MNKEKIVKKVKILKTKVKRLQWSKLALPIGVVILLLSVAFLLISGIKQYRQVQEIKKEMQTVGTEIQLGYHREIKLMKRLSVVEMGEYSEECKDFSFECLYKGSSIREEFLKSLENVSFTDSDLEVINMISSIDFSVKNNILEYDQLVANYNGIKSKYPLKIVKFLVQDLIEIS